MYISGVVFGSPEVVFGSPGLTSPDFHKASHTFKAFTLLLVIWAVFVVKFGEVQLFLLRHSLL